MSFLLKTTNSFRYAFSGIFLFFKTERNASIHLLTTFLVIFCGAILQISSNDWLWLTIAISGVICAEMINTSIEKLCNLITMEQNNTVKQIKDIAAAAVLIMAIAAVIIGLVVFLPYVFKLMG